jgi:hypothetical protein
MRDVEPKIKIEREQKRMEVIRNIVGLQISTCTFQVGMPRLSGHPPATAREIRAF